MNNKKRELRVADYLDHILEAIDKIDGYLKTIPNEQAFEANTLVQDAVVRNLEVLGEAANNVRIADPAFAAKHADIPWELMYGMRNRIMHGYFEINLSVVWQTTQRDLFSLRGKIETVLHELVHKK